MNWTGAPDLQSSSSEGNDICKASLTHRDVSSSPDGIDAGAVVNEPTALVVAHLRGSRPWS